MDWRVRPLQWVGPEPTGRRASQFSMKTTWSQTTELLQRELEHLKAKNIVLQLDVTDRDLRLDGWIRADAQPGSARVRLLFDSKAGSLTFQAGRFFDWRDNVRAVALGLEALRKIDRYGITTEAGEQYKGYRAIESGPDPSSVILAWSNRANMDDPQRAFREARVNSHPDRNNGDRDGWNAVEAAARKLNLI